MQSENQEMKDFYSNLNHPLCNVIQALRSVILSASPDISEQVKWNAPCFYYSGKMKEFDPKTYKRDMVVLNLRRKDHILLVFPTGSAISDDNGFLEGQYKDGRRLVKMFSASEVNENKDNLLRVINLWLDRIEK